VVFLFELEAGGADTSLAELLGFYEKLGYTVVNRIADFPPDGARYALTKTLDPA
jgi:ribosomal protein S18 acetylase RimI-like enzyme